MDGFLRDLPVLLGHCVNWANILGIHHKTLVRIRLPEIMITVVDIWIFKTLTYFAGAMHQCSQD